MTFIEHAKAQLEKLALVRIDSGDVVAITINSAGGNVHLYSDAFLRAATIANVNTLRVWDISPTHYRFRWQGWDFVTIEENASIMTGFTIHVDGTEVPT